jgi:acyl-coenzyme A synthetase/AMP-(fatty) acid ligase
VEPIFNQHPAVKRSALVGLGPPGEQRPVLVVEVSDRAKPNKTLVRSLSEFALRHAHTARVVEFVFRKSCPVDVRHNAKIHRLTLAKWASRKKRFEAGLS